MQRVTAILFGSLACGAVLAPGALGQIAPQPPSITEQEAQAIGIDAYLYFYSPVTMDLTRKQLTNVGALVLGSVNASQRAKFIQYRFEIEAHLCCLRPNVRRKGRLAACRKTSP